MGDLCNDFHPTILVWHIPWVVLGFSITHGIETMARHKGRGKRGRPGQRVQNNFEGASGDGATMQHRCLELNLENSLYEINELINAILIQQNELTSYNQKILA